MSHLKLQWTVHEALHGHDGYVLDVANFCMGDTHMLASGGEDGTVRVLRCNANTQQWSAHETLNRHDDGVRCVVPFSMDDTRMLASGGEDRIVRLWRASRNNTRTELLFF